MVLLEDDCAVPVHEHPVLQVPADGARQHPSFDLPAEQRQVLHGIAVGYVGDVMVDDRPGVELVGDVVGGRADRLDPLSWARR